MATRLALPLLLLQLLLLLAVASAASLLHVERDGHDHEDPATKTLQEICYKDVGCFRRDGHFLHVRYRPVSRLPKSPQEINVTYELFTRQNPDRGQPIIYSDADSVSKSNFKANKPIKVILFGYIEHPRRHWISRMRKAILKHCDCNVLLPDWSAGCGKPYWQAVANARVAGVVIGQTLSWLSRDFGASLDTVHLIAHSLGGQLAGYVGESLGGRIGRITGLDPAGPYFEFTHPTVRLDPTDARFVDVIHTDGNNTWSVITQRTGLGLMEPCGHVDFYPNGGRTQPNCPDRIPENYFCHHQRSNYIMESSLLNDHVDYPAVPCGSYQEFKDGKCSCGSIGCASLGIRANRWQAANRRNVKMYLDTEGAPPYRVRQ